MAYSVLGDRLVRDGALVPMRLSPHRSGRIVPTAIVLHDTADRPNIVDDSIRWFLSPKSRVSAHLVIGRDASVTQMVELDRQAWHAGKSRLDGRANCNGFTVGIEIDNPGRLVGDERRAVAWFGEAYTSQDGLTATAGPGHKRGVWMAYTPGQVEAIIGICRALVAAYPTITQIVGHWEISPGRKEDPNPLFPLDRVRREVFGPAGKPGKRDGGPWALGARGTEVRQAQEALKALGYKPGPVDGIFGAQTRAALLAWEAEQGRPLDGSLSIADLSALLAEDAKEFPAGPVTASVEAKRRSAAATVERTASVGAGLALVDAGVQAAGSDTSLWGLLMQGLDQLGTLAGKITGLGLTVDPKWTATALVVTVALALWRWATQAREEV